MRKDVFKGYIIERSDFLPAVPRARETDERPAPRPVRRTRAEVGATADTAGGAEEDVVEAEYEIVDEESRVTSPGGLTGCAPSPPAGRHPALYLGDGRSSARPADRHGSRGAAGFRGWAG